MGLFCLGLELLDLDPKILVDFSLFLNDLLVVLRFGFEFFLICL